MKWDVELWPRNPLDTDRIVRRPWWIPRPFWRRVSWIRAGCTALFLFAYVPIWLPPWGGKLRLIVCCMGILVGSVVFVVCPRVVFARMKAELAENDHLLCLWCGYPLRGLPNDHCCPECGTRYQAEVLRRTWQYWVKKRRLPSKVSGQQG